jgi:hypothetical protein
VTEVHGIQYDDAAGKTLVAYGLIQHFFDAPILANVADDTEKKLVFIWTVQMTNISAQQLKIQFRGS